ncbi:RsiV family protein [Clostridium nigeriense]|uniref:RsiV family protein n=1 Tax=Clostridium nigeriense TaxID=1805470 RepID=UPI003D324F49
MADKNLQELKKEYNEIPIPEELDLVVKNAFRDSGVYNTRIKTIYKRSGVAVASLAISTGILTVGVNSSPAFADKLSKIPVVSSIVKVITFKEYNINEDKYKANIEVPSIEGLENKALEDSLNEKYISENKKLYEDFITDMEGLKKIDDGHLGIESGYVVKTDNENILSIGRYVVNTVGTSSTTFEYDTIDKKNEILITLPSLFKDNKYIEIISENIKEQMRGQMKSDSKKVYWIDDESGNGNMDIFKEISENQNFYINDQSQLVISFNKYEVAPGYMGIVEFTISTDILSDVLVSNEYIK